MLFRHISQNKHEYNVRRMDEINEVIKEKELELENAEGFFQTFVIKLELRKLYKELNNHGTEVLEYEYLNANQDIH